MLKSYFRTAWRNILRYRSYSMLNISGLAIALSTFYLLLTYALDEFSYDRFHTDADRIYRVTSKLRSTGMETAMSGQPWGPHLVQDYHEIQAFTRTSFIINDVPIIKDDEIILEDGLLLVDSTFFEVFGFQQIHGVPQTIRRKSDIMITEEMAIKHFGVADPIGKTIRINLNGEFHNFQVIGVLQDPPDNSHLTFSMLLGKELGFEVYNVDPNNWRLHNGFTYVKLKDGISPDQIEAYLPSFFEKYSGPEFVERFEPALQPISEIHLHSDMFGEISPNGNLSYVQIALFMSAFVLLIGCVNYINLSTALSVKRAKEVGTRKVLGALRSHLIFQFLLESVMIALLAVLLSIWILHFVQPYFNFIADKSLTFNWLEDSIKLMIIGAVVGIISGIYPSFVLSGFEPIKILKGKFQVSGQGLMLRRALIICQFSLSIILFIGTGVIYQQIQYVHEKELGFSKEGVLIAFGITVDQMNRSFQLLKNELLQNTAVSHVATSSGYPSQTGFARRYRHEGFEGTDQELPSIHTIYANHDVVSALGLKIVRGRDFDRSISSDSTAIIINESAAKLFNYEDPIGRTLRPSLQNRSGLGESQRIIGMIQDFHFESLHQEIKPLVILMDPQRHYNLLVKFESNTYDNVLTQLEHIWKREFPEQAFNYNVLESQFNDLHADDYRLQQIFTYCSILAILIATLGLFGLATFMAQQKVKEIGIRKVLGASRSTIIAMLNKEFTIPVLIASLIGAPIAYYSMSLWLEDFAYRVGFSLWLIPMAGLFALVIAWLTVSYKSLRASEANPVEALRQE